MRTAVLCMLFISFIAISCASTDSSSLYVIENYTNPRSSQRYSHREYAAKYHDINMDRVIDIWKFYEKTEDPETQEILMRIIRKEVDSNFDGKVDIWLHYDKLETLVKEEVDSDFSGYIDRILHYKQGQLVKTEVYLDPKNRIPSDVPANDIKRHPNQIKHYRDGVLARIEIDLNADGIVDRWELYDRDGNLVQVGVDVDGDGRVDHWQHMPKPEDINED